MNSRLVWLLLLGLVACSANTGGGSDGSGGAKVGTGGATAGGTGGAATGGTGTGGTGGGIGTGGAATGGTGVGGTGTGGRATGGVGSGGSGSGGMGVGGAGTGGAAVSAFSVVTDRYDNARSGANMNETILNTTNVNRNTFGLLFSRTIVGFVFAQPLYVGGVTIAGVKHNVVYVATAHDIIYAFDADAAAPDLPLWSRNLGTSLTLGAGAAYNPGCTDMLNEVGITSTPVISLADNKIFVVAKTTAGQDLHSLDLATGADTAGSPVPVGNMAMTAFDSHVQLSRAGLLLLGGVVYILQQPLRCRHVPRLDFWIRRSDAANALRLQSHTNRFTGLDLAVGCGPRQRRHFRLGIGRQRHHGWSEHGQQRDSADARGRRDDDRGQLSISCRR